MNPLMRTLLALATAFAVLAAPLTYAGDKHPHEKETVTQLLDQAHRTLTKRGAEYLPEAIAPYFAFEVWGKFLIQPRKEAFNTHQRHAFRQLLPGFMAHLYHDQFAKGLSNPPVVVGVRRARRKDVLVGSQFPRSSGPDLPVEWRVRRFRDGNFRIIDIMIGGTSFMLLKREEFTAIIDRDGADGLIAYLRRNAL